MRKSPIFYQVKNLGFNRIKSYCLLSVDCVIISIRNVHA